MNQIEYISRKTAEQPIRRNAEVVAIGDVHGCVTLLRETIRPYLGSGAELIFLGDLIDRSPEPDGDQQVIELVRKLQSNAGDFIQLLMDKMNALQEIESRVTARTFAAVMDPTKGPEVRDVLAQLLAVLDETSSDGVI